MSEKPSVRMIVTITRAYSYDQENLNSVRFVPLIGEAGWNEAHG